MKNVDPPRPDPAPSSPYRPLVDPPSQPGLSSSGYPQTGPGKRPRPSSASFKVGAIALAFLILGYQAAVFVSRASRLRLEANRDRPDTVYVYVEAPAEGPAAEGAPSVDGSTPSVAGSASGSVHGDRRFAAGASRSSAGTSRSSAASRSSGSTYSSGASRSSAYSRPSAAYRTERRNAPHTPYVEQYRRATRRVESFRFDPNTVSVDDLIRLGFSEKQAQAIDNYRAKGGRFRRKADFAKSFVVADSVFKRLERFIDIPKVDLNRADSAALDALPGIGPWYAARIVRYRAELGGFSFPEQLLDIYRFDQEKYDGLADLVFCSEPAPYALWSLPADSLRLHPYIRSWQAARSIALFRDHTPREGWTVAALGEAGILPPDDIARLARCRLAEP